MGVWAHTGVCINTVLFVYLLIQTPVWAQTPIPLVTGKSITPQGTQTPVGSFPCNMLLSPDGKFIVVTNAGFRQYLTVLSVEDGRIVSQIAVGKAKGKEKEGLYYGLAWGGSIVPSERPGANRSAPGWSLI